MRRIALAVAATTALTIAALGAGTQSASAAPATYNWTGFYVGGTLGGAWADVNWSNVTLTTEPVKNSVSGFAGGGHIGFNHQMGSLVLGVEGSFLGTDLSGTSTSVVNPAAVRYTSKISWIATVVGRLGFAWDRSLIYIDGGYAAGRVQTSGTQATIPDSFSLTKTESGWTIGGGWEFLFPNKWIFGIDYKYIDLGTTNRSSTTATGIAFTITDVNPTINVVTARLSWKFP